MQDPPLNVRISGLNIDEIKEIASKVREIEHRNPKRTFFIWIEGFEHLNIEEVIERMREIYPEK